MSESEMNYSVMSIEYKRIDLLYISDNIRDHNRDENILMTQLLYTVPISSIFGYIMMDYCKLDWRCMND